LEAAIVGAEIWYYAVPYAEDATAALLLLREREFRAGRYFPARYPLEFSWGEPRTGSQAAHASIDAARDAAGEAGTKCVLDFDAVDVTANERVIRRLGQTEVCEIFGTSQPTVAQVGTKLAELFERIDRGCAVVLSAGQGPEPTHLIFVGASAD
jgi:hypothetical protein